MQRFFNSLHSILAIDGIIFIFCALGIYHTVLKIDLPIKFKSSGSVLVIKEVYGNNTGLQAGDTVVSIDNYKFSSEEEIEVYLDGIHQSQSIKINYFKSGLPEEIWLKPIKFYSTFYIIIDSVTGFLFFLFGIFVLIKKPTEESARLFHWVTIGTAVIVTTTWGNYAFGHIGVGYVLRFLFSIAYTLSPVFFFHFALIFPSKKTIKNKSVLYILYFIAGLLGISSYCVFLYMSSHITLSTIQLYLTFFNVCRFLIVACIISGLIVFLHSYETTREESEKKKLRWVLLGLIIGPLGFALLWVVPQAFTSYGLIPEEIILVMMLTVPVTFSIAILRYHLLDIDLIIKRSVIYFAVIGGLLLVYIALIFVVTNLVKNINDYTISSVSAIIIALLFQPAKNKVQKIVDRKFFRVQYDFREALKKFFNEVKGCNTKKMLTTKIVEQVNNLLPVTKIGFFDFDPIRSRITLIAHKNFDLLEGRSVYLNQTELKSELNLPVALPDKVEASVALEIADNRVFRRWGIALVLPIKSTNAGLLGFLVLGEIKSGQKFSMVDVDLLLEVSLQAGFALERIIIQEELIQEQLIKEKLEELNRLKSFFISSVSHELKTPLTSIKMFSELLQLKKNYTAEESEEYLDIIIGECDRLGRLIEDVLDLSKIERNVKKYHFSEIDIKALLSQALKLMSYQLKMEKCTIEKNICQEEFSITGDKDSVMSAIINILSNGLKFSIEPKRIIISLYKENGYIALKFENNGPAISEDEICFITEPYFRSEETKRKNIPGSGIGLALVQQIMNAHRGKLEIQNNPSGGCSFKLNFLLEEKDETNLNN